MRSKSRSAMWCVAVWVLGLLLCPGAAAQPITHRVEKGETLWSICEKYYGTPEAWPKLWEMNPFITNPHLLRPGDLLTIAAGERAPRAANAAPPAIEPPKPFVTPEQKKSGIRVARLTKLNARGFLVPEKATPLGRVHSSDSQKILLSKGDHLFLDFGDQPSIRTGDSYLICRLLPLEVAHVITKARAGYQYSVHALVILRERTVGNMFRAEIAENYGEVLLGDLVFPVNAVPECLKPLPGDPALRGVVIATRDQGTAFGRNSVVYLDSGRSKNLVPGTLLELVRFGEVNPSKFPPRTDYLEREAISYEKTIGRMIVLDSGPETATALVLSATETFRVGTYFRGVSSWQELPGSREFQPSCDLE